MLVSCTLMSATEIYKKEEKKGITWGYQVYTVSNLFSDQSLVINFINYQYFLLIFVLAA